VLWGLKAAGAGLAACRGTRNAEQEGPWDSRIGMVAAKGMEMTMAKWRGQVNSRGQAKALPERPGKRSLKTAGCGVGHRVKVAGLGQGAPAWRRGA
jgi:hypothetical protein